jgi:hypothetical protein
VRERFHQPAFEHESDVRKVRLEGVLHVSGREPKLRETEPVHVGRPDEDAVVLADRGKACAHIE